MITVTLLCDSHALTDAKEPYTAVSPLISLFYISKISEFDMARVTVEKCLKIKNISHKFELVVSTSFRAKCLESGEPSKIAEETSTHKKNQKYYKGQNQGQLTYNPEPPKGPWF